ncbi:MAG: cell envelope integrity protein CreD [Bacteroidota bacterium]
MNNAKTRPHLHLLFRVGTIVILMLLMLVPLSMVDVLISERKSLQASAISKINQSWSNSQTLTGPILVIPYCNQERKKIGPNEFVSCYEEHVPKYAFFMPEKLNIDAHIYPKKLHIGIYESVVYESKQMVEGSFQWPNFTTLGISPENLLYDKAFFVMGLSDLRGIQSSIEMKTGDDTHTFDPGSLAKPFGSKSLSTPFPLDPTQAGAFDFSLSLDLLGSQGLHIAPVGKTTQVHIDAPWSTPNFSGSFLPDDRLIQADQFSADWKVLHLNRNYPQQWKGNKYQTDSQTLGVNLLIGVDEYKKNERSIKYGIMIIALVFMVFFFVEVLTKQRTHPIQYALVGLSKIVFFVLLLSLSEQIGFNRAFIFAAGSVILLVTGYMKSVWKDNKLTLLMAGLLSLLYSFNYTLLQLEEYSLLAGSIGLFIILAASMWVTRNINWFAITRSDT